MYVSALRELGLVACFGLSSLGAVLGMSANGPAVIGSWKKSALNNKPVPFIMVVFAATCLSNIIYGYIAMDALDASITLSAHHIMYLGIIAGLCIGANAFVQAVVCAHAAEAYAETQRNFGNYIMVVGVAETFALFVMVFVILIA
jgi:V/A-type H+-transporting ATPase subunit K